MSSNRINYMDAIRALAMYLVIWGHCILHLSSWDRNDDAVFVVLNTFHVSLFMMVAGYFSVSALSLSFRNVLLRKTKELIVPYLLWAIPIASLLYYYDGTGLAPAVKNYFDCLWFLKSLFCCYLLAYLTVRLHKVLAMIVIAASIVLTVFKVNVMFPAFMLGYYIRKAHLLETNIKLTRLLWILLPVFCVLACFYDGHYFNSPNNMAGIIKEASLNTWLMYIAKTAYRIVIGICGALAVVLLFNHFCSAMKDNYVCKIGKETLGIYILQTVILEVVLRQYITYYGNQGVFDYLIAPVASLIMMIICYALTIILTKNEFTKRWLLGKFPKK